MLILDLSIGRVAGLIAVFAAACLPVPRDLVGLDCDTAHPCPNRLFCVDEHCALSPATAHDGGSVDASVDAGSVDAGSDAGLDAGGVAPTCVGNCSCSGTSCTCDGPAKCVALCSSACSYECRSSNACEGVVGAGSQIRCAGDGGCNITCGGGSCHLTCLPGVPCRMLCGNSNCTLDCQGGTVLSCPAVQACNRGC